MKLVQSYADFYLHPNNPHHFSPLPCDSHILLRQTLRSSSIPVAKYAPLTKSVDKFAILK